jgi:hypothetical protein
MHASPASAAIAPPSGLTPSGISVSGSPVLTWNRVAGATGYNVQYSTDSDFSIGVTKVSTVNRRYVPKTRLATTTIWWRVQTKVGSAVSGWSTTSFDVDPSAGPALIAPGDGDTLSQPDQPLLLSWSPVPGALSYTVEIDDSPGFPNVNTTATGIKNTAYIVQNPQVATTYYWHVKAVFDNGVVSSWSEENSFQIAGLAAPGLVRPADNPTVGIQDIVLEWSPVPGATKYELEVSVADSFNTTRESRDDIVGTTYTPTRTWWNDQYFWHVRAIDAFGNKSPWGDTWRFKREWPDQPERQYPAPGQTVGNPLFFQWTAVPFATRYTVYWKSTAESTWHACSVFGDATTVHTTLAGCGPTTEGDYEWRVQFWDDPGPVVIPNEYPGGPIPGEAIVDGQQFHYDPTLVETPTAGPQVTGLRAAISGTASQTPSQFCAVMAPARCENMRQTPVLRWNPVEGATKYELVIANDAALTNVVETRELTGTMYTRTSSLIENQATNGYYWQVQPCFGPCPHVFDPSQHHVFNKKSNLAELVSPADNAQLHSDVVTFKWKDWLETNLSTSDTPQVHTDVTGVNSQLEARQYKLVVSTVPNFQSTVYTATVDEREHSVPTKLLPEGVLYWRLIPIDGSIRELSDSGPYDPDHPAPDVRTFRKTTPSPTLKVLNGGLPLTQTVPLEWNSSPFAASYNVEVYKNDDTLGQVGNRVASLTSKQIAVILSSPLPVSSTRYRWRVQKVDASGNKGPWSDLSGPNSSFTVAASAPAQTSPVNGARLSSVDGYFTWTPVQGAASYRFERRRVGATGLDESAKTSALAWASTSTIADGTWQWRVVAVNTAGKDMGASGWRSFLVDGTRPTVKSFSPANGATVKRSVNFKATFSEPVTNVTTATVKLYRKGSSTPVKGKVTLSASKTVMTFNPTKYLTGGKKYTLKISANVRDLAGLQLVPKFWSVTAKQ